MVGMRLLFFSVVLLSSLLSFSSAVPAGLELEEASLNATSDPLLSSRSLEKREVFNHCNNAGFSGTLSQALKDATVILSNMVDHLELAISLYKDDDSGELKPEKASRDMRTFDEHNAFVSYIMFISKIYWGPGDHRNKEGLKTLKGTRDLAQTMKNQYEAYQQGRSIPWTRGGIPYINIFCDDDDVYSERNSAGLTYTEDQGLSNPSRAKGGGLVYWVSQTKGAPEGKEIWIPLLEVCATQEGKGQKRFGIVPASPGIKAYVYRALYGLVEETMVFCPLRFDSWMATESNRLGEGYHYRDLHVKIGSEPTDEQKAASKKLMGLSDFTTGKPPRATRWLSDFLVLTMIHESTHAEAFTGPGKTLDDIMCKNWQTDEVTQRSTDPGCMAQIAKGTDGTDEHGNMQGHKDAEAFAMYAMTTWVNSVYWYSGYLPKDRDNWNPKKQ